MNKDYFKSVPQEGAIERDWTKGTLVLDIDNSIGEHYHFEIKPNEKDNLPTRASDAPLSESKNKRVINLHLPIL